MKIECIIQRRGGTRINLGGKAASKGRIVGGVNYHFTPGQDKDGKDLPGPHVCEVRDQSHIARLLAIPESYRIYDPKGELTDPVKTAPPQPPAGPPVGGVPLTPPARSEGGGAPTQPQTGQTSEPGGQGGEGGTDAGKPDGQGNGESPFAKLSDVQLFEEVEKKIGKKPHPNSKRETLIRILQAPAPEKPQ